MSTEQQRAKWRAKNKKYRDINREYHAKYKKKLYAANPEKEKERVRQYRLRNGDAVRERQRIAQRLMKQKCFDHYGRECECCGQTEEAFLTLGHVNGDGASHRRAKGENLYRDLIRRGFPDDIRAECYNCNCGAFRNGGVCPHVKLRQAPISTA
jgi:hypothetical protein